MKQIQFTKIGWRERMLNYNEDKKSFFISYSKNPTILENFLPKNKDCKKIGVIYEIPFNMISFLENLFNKINNLSKWIMNGADQTFKSYNIEIAEFIKDGFEDDNIDKVRDIFLSKLTKEHVYFFKNLKLTYAMGDYLFVHAGINPEKSLSEQSDLDFIWSRSDKFFDKNFKISNDLNLSPPKIGKGYLVEINKILLINNFCALNFIIYLYNKNIWI